MGWMDSQTTRVADNIAPGFSGEAENMMRMGWALDGLLATGEQQYIDKVKEMVDRSIATQTSQGQLAFEFNGWGAHDWQTKIEEWTGTREFKPAVVAASVGPAVLALYERTDDEAYLDAAERQYEYLQEIERTVDGGIPQRENAIELWIDTVYFVSPFLAQYGSIADDTSALEDAVRQLEVHNRYLREPRRDLYRHIWRENPDSYPQSTFWARGNAWMLTALVDTLEYLPDGFNGKKDLVRALQSLSASLVELQDRSGYWRNVLDDTNTPLESSASIMYAYAFKKGINMGLLDASYEEPAQRALDVTRELVDEEGNVPRQALTPGGPGVPLGVDTYGQGFYLLANAQFQE